MSQVKNIRVKKEKKVIYDTTTGKTWETHGQRMCW